MNNIFTVVNLAIVSLILVMGALKSNLHNWNLNPKEVDRNHKIASNKSLNNTNYLLHEKVYL